MSLYRYEATDKNGKTMMGAMDAAGEPEVADRLKQLGYVPNTIYPSATATPPHKTRPPKPAAAIAGQRFRFFSTVKAGDHALFFRQFATLTKSGISIYQAMSTLGPRMRRSPLATACEEIQHAAQSGGKVSDVMFAHPELFGSHVAASVRAGELGGFLEISLDEIALDYEREVEFYRGTWLPKSLIIQEIFTLALAQPLFPTLFPNAEMKRYLLLAFVRNGFIAVAFIATCMFVYRILQSPSFCEQRDRLALRIPVFGNLTRQKSLSSFIRMLRRLYSAGLGPVAAWEGAMNVAPNAVIRKKLVSAGEMMRRNVPLHEAFVSTGLFANEMEQLLATGVVSGQVVEMLDKVADYYEANVERAFKNSRFWMFRLAITMFIVLIGAVVIWMTKSYFDSVFNFTKGWE